MKVKTIIAALAVAAAAQASAQSIITLNDDDFVFGKITEINDQNICYETADRVRKLPLSQVKLYETETGGITVVNPDKINKVDTAECTSMPYAKGNCVYIPYSSSSVEVRYGSKRLRELLYDDGYWRVVGSPEEAHCTFEYVFDDKGLDKAYLRVIDKAGYVVYVSKKVSARDLVPRDAGTESAERIFKKCIPALKER